jgi:hypothetical protein
LLGCFDANGNLLTLDNIGTLHWHYNNTLNKLTKSNKSNAIEYYVYDYQGNRVRTGLGGWWGFVAMHYCLLGETGWLGCCLCRRCRLAGRVIKIKNQKHSPLLNIWM